MVGESVQATKPWRYLQKETKGTRFLLRLEGIAGIRIEANDMTLELKDQERDIIRRALEVYLSDLREEITKTEKHEWKAGLHAEEDVLKRVIERLG